MSDKYHENLETKASRRMLIAVGIKLRQFIPKLDRFTIDFNLINK